MFRQWGFPLWIGAKYLEDCLVVFSKKKGKKKDRSPFSETAVTDLFDQKGSLGPERRSSTKKGRGQNKNKIK
jgi:hypothetical protein